MVVDESHITEARADKLPKLIRGLLKSFNASEDIRSGVIMVINRTDKNEKI